MSSGFVLPLSGFFRVLYFIAATVVTFALVATATAAVVDRPEDRSFLPPFEAEQADFRRDNGLLLTLAGTAAMGTAILAFGSRSNPLRSGLLLGGTLLFVSGLGGFELLDFGSYRQEQSDEWLAVVECIVAFIVVIGAARWIDEGLLPRWLKRRGLRTEDTGDEAPPTASI